MFKRKKKHKYKAKRERGYRGAHRNEETSWWEGFFFALAFWD